MDGFIGIKNILKHNCVIFFSLNHDSVKSKNSIKFNLIFKLLIDQTWLIWSYVCMVILYNLLKYFFFFLLNKFYNIISYFSKYTILGLVVKISFFIYETLFRYAKQVSKNNITLLKLIYEKLFGTKRFFKIFFID